MIGLSKENFQSGTSKSQLKNFFRKRTFGDVVDILFLQFHRNFEILFFAVCCLYLQINRWVNGIKIFFDKTVNFTTLNQIIEQCINVMNKPPLKIPLEFVFMHLGSIDSANFYNMIFRIDYDSCNSSVSSCISQKSQYYLENLPCVANEIVRGDFWS